MEQVLLSEMVPKEILQELQDAFARFTGMASLISDADGVPITNGSNFTHFCMDMTRKSEVGGINCAECGRKGALYALKTGRPAVYPCHAGLMDYAAPIMLNNTFIGSFTGGQVRTHDVDEAFVRQKAVEYDIDPDEYVRAAKATNVLPKEEIERSAQFLSEIASVLSKLAYQRYHLLEEKRLVEQSTKIRAQLLKKYSVGLNSDLQQLTDFLIQVADDGVEKDDVQTRNFSEQMADNMFRHVSELGDAIDYMEVENDNFTLRENIYDIRWLVERKISEQQAMADKKHVSILHNVGDEVPRLLAGDPSRIGSVIGKCIENSLYFSEEGEVFVEIHSRKEGYATVLEMWISDKGVGMPEEDRQKIERYIMSRGISDSFNEEYESFGFATIGYAICAMSGTLRIESELHKGTTFVVSIPQVEG